MPLLKRKPFKRNPMPEGLKDDEEVFYCDQTQEIFKNYDEFFERCMLTNSVIWTCSLTGRPELTFSEALESEKTALKLLRQFPSALRAPVIFVASKTKRSALRELVDDVFNIIKDRFFVEEKLDVLNASGGRSCRFCKITEIIKPADYDSTKTYDQMKVEYRVEAVDDTKEPQTWITRGECMRRDKTIFSKEKTKLFLKQNVEGISGMLVMKAASIKKYVTDRNFIPEEAMTGKLPDFEVSKKIQLLEEKSKNRKSTTKKSGKQGDITKYLNNAGAPKKELTAEEKLERDEKSKKFREELEAMKKEKADREAERLKLIQLEKQRIVAKTQATVRELNQIRDDLELTDHRIIPKSKPISTIIDKKYFADFVKILEFLHSFPEALSISDKFPYGIDMDMLERALILKEVNGPLSDILQVFLSTIFSLQIEERNEIKIEYRMNGDAPLNHSKIDFMRNASRINKLVYKHYNMQVNMLALDSSTLSELLRLHFLCSGALLSDQSSKARFQARGGYRSMDDPGLTLITKHPHIIQFLTQYSVFQLPTRDIIRIATCLIDQILSYSNLRDIVEERIEKGTNARLEYRRLKLDERRREQKVIDQKKELQEAHKQLLTDENVKPSEKDIKKAEVDLQDKIAKIDAKSIKDHANYLKDLKAQTLVFFNHQTYLGADRAFRNYYIFESMPGLFVEHDISLSGKCVDTFVKNNPALAHSTKEQRYGIIKQMVTSEESLSEHNKENNVDVNGTSTTDNKNGVPVLKKESDLDIQRELLMCNCDPNTCIVHSENIERTVWSYYNTPEEIDALIESLNIRGFREKNLREQLVASRDLIADYVQKCPVEKLTFDAEKVTNIISEVKRANRSGKTKKYDDPNFESRPGTDINEILDVYLRVNLLDFERKLSAGCLGNIKVSDKVLWRKYIHDGEYYALQEDDLKWGRSTLLLNGTATNGHAKENGSSRGSNKYEDDFDDDDDDDEDDEIGSVASINQIGGAAADSGNCSDLELSEESEQIKMKTSEVEAVKLKVKNLAMALLQIEQGIDMKFIRAPFGPARDVKDKNAMTSAYELSKKRLAMWEELLMKATNYSQVFLHFNILYDSIKWSQSAQHIGCLVCRSKSNPEETLLCDECNKGWHMFCLKPRLTEIPTGDWFCPRCRPENYIVKRAKKRRAVVVEEDSDEEDQEEETEKNDDDDDDDDSDDSADPGIEYCSNCKAEGELSEFVFCSDCSVRCHIDCAKPPPKARKSKKWKCQKCVNAEKRSERVKRRRMDQGIFDDDDNDETVEEIVEVEEDDDDDEEDEIPLKISNRRSRKVISDDSDDDDDDDNDSSSIDEKARKLNDGSKRSSRRASNRHSRRNSLELNISDKHERRSSRKFMEESSASRRASKRSLDSFNTISLSTLIDEIIKNDKAWPFRTPVSTAEVPDYLDVIKNPMDFSKIKSKLNLGDYNSNEQAMKDIQLIFYNCDLYNNASSEIYKSGSKLEKFVMKRARDLNLPFKASDMNSV